MKHNASKYQLKGFVKFAILPVHIIKRVLDKGHQFKYLQYLKIFHTFFL